jgi:hypothetical protein
MVGQRLCYVIHLRLQISVGRRHRDSKAKDPAPRNVELDFCNEQTGALELQRFHGCHCCYVLAQDMPPININMRKLVYPDILFFEL